MNPTRTFLVVFAALILPALTSFAGVTPAAVPASPLLMEINGRIYPKDQFPSNCTQLFQGAKCDVESYGRYRLEAKKDGDLVYNYVTFSGPEGDQVIEQSWEKDGKVKKAIIENRAIGKRSQLEVKDGVAFYEVTDLADKSVKKSQDDAEENLVVPSTMLNYVKMNQPRINRGETIQIKMAVLDRRDSFSFNIQKVREEKGVDGEPIQVLLMSPASFLVKAAVDPMYFYVKPKNSEMFAFEGESGLRRKVGNAYEKMKVRTAYDYRYPSAQPAKKQ
jgi:hypothetical protein